MTYFDKYVSNTCAGSGNQMFFNMNEDEVRTGRMFYKIFAGGEYNYSILFSNIIDTTFFNGAVSHANLICDSWKILGARAGKCKSIPEGKDLADMTLSDTDENADIFVTDLRELTFSSNKSKEVMPGEFFATDPIKLNFNKNEYLCLEITFTGKMIPHHRETLLPVYIKSDTGWEYSNEMPFASMIGCDRPIKARIAYLGDSITQGIGAGYNTYSHWNARLSEKIGEEYAYWNLGLGFARAHDAASDGAWLYKAKQSDIVFVCLGVNDIGDSAKQIKSDLKKIVDTLKKEGKTVILQTIPPFNYEENTIADWKSINDYVKNELSQCVDFVFDTVPYLSDSEQQSHIAKFGGHPTSEGCRIWADALYESLRCKTEKIINGDMI